jgi:multiple sugar transport system substrate-binding protein
MVLVLLLLAGCGREMHAPQQEKSITILWARWAPADYLQELSRDFTRETGIQVVVKQVPWDDFQNVFFDSVARRSGEYDLVGGDSQWLGRGAVSGIYINLTQWIIDHHVDRQMAPAALKGYCEYPKHSRRYWAVPLEGDAMGFAYRKDLFEDPDERARFRQAYGYELQVPRTWEELRDIAEFFYRPEKELYGANIWGSRQYDGITMGVESLIWAYGGDLGDAKTYKVRGSLDTPESTKGLEMYKAIHRYGAPSWRTSYIDVNEGFIQGKTAMVMSYFAFFPDLLDPAKNPFASVTGFFANPRGPRARVSSLGGQGLSLLSYTKKKAECLKFLEWFIRPQVQKKWALLGGYSCDSSVLASDEFLDSKPYNRALQESMMMMRDFWTVPEYADLLEISQKYWYRFLILEDMTAAQANDMIAREWESVFEAAGYYKE